MIDIIDRLDEFTDEQRMDVFYNYCTFCFANIAVQGEIEQLSELIQKMKASGKTDTEILDELESVMKHIIEDCKTGWR